MIYPTQFESQTAPNARIILETQRFYLREITPQDFPILASILQDPRVMYAYEHSFTDEEVAEWMNRQISRYNEDGFGLWLIIDHHTGECLGQSGLTLQTVEGIQEIELGYLLKFDHWHKGYAVEAGKAILNYAKNHHKLTRIVCTIRDSNTVSQKVALRLHMQYEKSFIKHYFNMQMIHYLYAIKL